MTGPDGNDADGTGALDDTDVLDDTDATDDTDAAVAARWNANAERWTADVRAGFDTYRDAFTWPAFERFVGDLVGDVRGLDVMDLGCGEGTNTRRLARLGARMTGRDLSAGLIGHARRAENDEPLGIAYHVGSFSERGAPDGSPAHSSLADGSPADGSFDLVVSTLALMDGVDFDGAMREARRLLRPGGRLAFSILHPCHVTPGLRWEKDGDGRTTGLVVDRYHDRTPFTERWRFGDRPKAGEDERVEPFAVPRFPRTLADILNAVAAAGLTIERVAEPVPDAPAVEATPRFARWRDHAAFLLLVGARRPSARGGG